MRARRILAIALTAPFFAGLPAQDAWALPPASTVIPVNDSSSDAPLSSQGRTSLLCESTDATGGCTLRAGVELADALSLGSGEQVTVDLPAGTYTNTAANGRQLTIAAGSDVRIAGAGARRTAIDGGAAGSVIYVQEPAATLRLEGVTVRDGSGLVGGGIYAEGDTSVQIENTTIAENEAVAGGGVFVAPEGGVSPGAPTARRPKAGTVNASPPVPPTPGLSIVGSTIAHNRSAAVGGGVYIENDQLNRIVNSTIAENKSEQQGGGLAVVFAGVLMSMDTLVENSAEADPTSANIAEGEPAGILLHQSLIVEPANSNGPGCEGIGIYQPESAEYNLDFPSTRPQEGEFDACGLSEPRHDLVGADPRLEPGGLADNGGETDTIAPFGGYSSTPSPAVDTVPLAQCGEIGEGEIATSGEDQRGSPRPDPNGPVQEPNCDIGAYEFAATIVTPRCSAPPPVNAGERVTVPCTIEKSEGLFATGTTVSFALPAGATLVSSSPSQGSCAGAVCQLGTIDPATVTIVLAPSASGALTLTASDKERGAQSTSVPVTVKTVQLPTPLAQKANRCKSRRDFKIHIQNVRRLKIVSAVVYVNKHREQAVKGRALHAAINLRGLPKGRFTVRIVARTASGERLVGVRVYHTCVGRRPQHKHLFL